MNRRNKELSEFCDKPKDMSGDTALRVRVPSDPLAPYLALKNSVLVGGVCTALPPAPLRALLRWNFSVRSESAGCSRAHLPNLSVGSPPRVVSQCLVKSSKTVFGNFRPALRDDARKGPRAETLVPREDERASSRWLQAAMRNRSAGEPKAGGVVLRTPRLRALDLSKRIEAQKGSLGTRTRSAVSPDMSPRAVKKILSTLSQRL